jgi:hypothetical protein
MTDMILLDDAYIEKAWKHVEMEKIEDHQLIFWENHKKAKA